MAAGHGEPAARQRGEVERGEEERGKVEAGRCGELAARQRKLVAALVAGAEPPAGLDLERVRVQTAALLRKRGRSVAHAQPDLAAALGTGFGAAFQGYARERTGPPPGRAADDALEFARYLLGAGGDRHPSAAVRREARRVTRHALFRLGRQFHR